MNHKLAMINNYFNNLNLSARISKATLEKLYQTIQIKLALHCPLFTLFILIPHIILYNLIDAFVSYLPKVYAESLIDFLPSNTTDSEYADPFNYPVTINEGGIPHTWSNHLPDPVSQETDGNATCEDAAYRQTQPLQEEPSKPIVNPQNPLANLTEEDYQAKITYISMVSDHTIAILNAAYPNANPADIDDISIKNATLTALRNHGNVSVWTAKSHSDILNENHDSNVYIGIIQALLETGEGEMSTIQTRLLCHLGTSMTIVNSASALNIPPAQIEQIFNHEVYQETFAKFTKNTNLDPELIKETHAK